MHNLTTILLLCLLAVWQVSAQSTTGHNDSTTVPLRTAGAPVVLAHDTLFYLYDTLGPYTPAERAGAAGQRLAAVLDNQRLHPDSIRVVGTGEGFDIMLGGTILLIITADDVPDTTLTAEQAALRYAALLRSSLHHAREVRSPRALLIAVGTAGAFLAAALLLLWLMRLVFPRLYSRTERLEPRLPTLRIRSFTIVEPAGLARSLLFALRALRLVLSLLIVYTGISLALDTLPWTRHWDIVPLLRGVLLAGLLTVTTVVLYRHLHRLAQYATVCIRRASTTRMRAVTLKKVELLSGDRIAEMSLMAVRILRTTLDVLMFYLYVTLLFSLFSFTRTWASTLFSYITTPLAAVLHSFTAFLPNLFVILVTIAVAYYLIKCTRWIFEQIENGSLEFTHFYADWARPTYGIIRLLIIVFTLIIIFPYLPGSGSPAFENVTLFLGLLLSISSASAVANAIAGVVLTYMRPFRVGDRVKIADTMGDVVEKTILVTRVRTTKNVEITVPNAMVLSSHIINYSTSAQERGLILHTKVTIGYDVPWRTVHELLLGAARTTEGLLHDPRPFVLQTALNDFYVEYELNAYTNSPNAMASIYSALHAAIQDRFNEAGVEIMSPHYSAVRDGHQTTIPEQYLPKGYEVPAFRLFGVNLFGRGNKSAVGGTEQ